LSVPAILERSSLNTPDLPGEAFAGAMVPGACAADAPVAGPHGDWLLTHLEGGFTLLAFGASVPAGAVAALAADTIPCGVIQVGGSRTPGAVLLEDKETLLAKRYDALSNTCFLLRPDQHICARWRTFDLARVRAAVARASGSFDAAMNREAA